MKTLMQAGVYVRTLVYLSTLGLALAAIIGVIRSGASLPPPQGSFTVEQHARATLEQHSSVMTLLRANLDDPLSHLLIQLLAVILACRLLGSFLSRLGLPAVVGEMSAGILLGPSLFGLLAPDGFRFVFSAGSLGTLHLLSQVGICLFMFTVGMEVNIAHVRQKARAAIAVSHTSIVFPFLLGVLSAYFLFNQMAGRGASFIGFALFMGISMSITAFPVLARILQERNIARTSLGSTAITCAAVGDMTAWIILAFVVAIAKATNIAASGFTLVLSLIFVAVMILIVRSALPRWIGKDQLGGAGPSNATLAAVVCGVLASALATEAIGIHSLFGAFVFGAVMPDSSEFRRRIMIVLERFSSVMLLPLYFAFTGLRTELGLLSGVQDWLICLGIIAVATAGKLGGSAVAARVTGMGWRESLQLGALMNTRGLMELIALNIGYELGILSPRIFTMLVIMALTTTVMTGPVLTLLGNRQPLGELDREPSRV
jgi:K+:H+ antiporter